MADTFTVGEAEDRVRDILLDDFGDSYRFTHKEIYREMQSAIERIWLRAPSSRYVNGLIVHSKFLAGTEGSDAIPDRYDDDSVAGFQAWQVNMERRWLDALVYYVVHKMYLKDDADTANAGLADRYLQLHNEALA